MSDAAVWLDEAENSRKVKFPCGVLITNEGVRLQFSLAARAVGQSTADAGHVPSSHNTLLSQAGFLAEWSVEYDLLPVPLEHCGTKCSLNRKSRIGNPSSAPNIQPHCHLTTMPSTLSPQNLSIPLRQELRSKTKDRTHPDRPLQDYLATQP